MSVNYSAALKSTRMAAVITAIDVDAQPAYIEICSAAFAGVLATIVLADPSFTESGGVITMAGVPKSGVAALSGTAAVARIKNGAGVTVVNNLTVGAGSGDISLNSVSITAGQTITITAGTLTHSA